MVIERIGDNPIESGGCVVITSRLCGAFLQYTPGLGTDDYTDKDKLKLYEARLCEDQEDFERSYGWIPWSRVFYEEGGKSYLKTLNMGTYFGQALALKFAADFLGWHEFDCSPTTVTVEHLTEEWELQ
jgi:hypothetical protein